MEDHHRTSRFIKSIQLPLIFIGLLWLIHAFQVVSGISLGFLGVYPRDIWGLRGILFAPLLHSDIYHLISNSLPLLALGTLIFYFYPRVANRAIILIYLLTGVVVWFLARHVFHIGASGVVYGLVAFVFWTGIFRRSLQSVVLGLIVTVMYSGYFAGIFPNEEGISWESHLYGALVGIFVAYFYKEELELEEEAEKKYDPFANEPDKRFFLDRDVFEKTKQERAEELRQQKDSDWHSSNTWD